MQGFSLRTIVSSAASCLFAALACAAACAQPPADDPVLALARPGSTDQEFRLVIAHAITRHPSIGEAVASSKQLAAARAEAKAGLFPTVDLTATSYRVLARNFNPNDIDTIYENSRAHTRTDVLGSVTQTVFDFGATSNRISAASARLRAGAAGIDDAVNRVALATIAAWYDIFSYRALVALADQRLTVERGLRGDIGTRIERGFSATGDLLRVDSAIAATASRAAGYRRQLADAEARFREMTGEGPPAALDRAPAGAAMIASADMARAAADQSPPVRQANEQAEAARKDARASRADRLPNLTTGIEAGRYGFLEHKPDYDVRAQVTLRQRFSGALIARARQVDQRAVEAAARADRIRLQAERDATIAFTDVSALDEQVKALEASYVAGRDSRVMQAERFRLARGTLFDVLSSQDAEFGAAAAFIDTLGERDAARYVLLARTGKLLDALGIDTALLGPPAIRRAMP